MRPLERNEAGVRLNKLIADSGHCSRREADRLIEAGRVRLDGRVGVLGDRVLPGQQVTLDGRTVAGPAERVYLMLNKPRGVVCTADPREPLNVVDYLNYPVRVFPIGRLDKDSEGLLLLTSDGEIVNRVLRAAGGHEKEYLVTVNAPITPEFLRRMASGVPVLDRITLPCRIEQTGPRSFRLILVQGLNRQIRRMCEYLGYRVVRLVRVRIMNIRLDGLQEGHFRKLTGAELDGLMAQLAPPASDRGQPGL